MTTFDRNKVEEVALRYLARGQAEKAVQAYAALLKHDPRDRRIRQKLADALLRAGRTADAVRQYRDLAQHHSQDGSHRAAIAIYKHLMTLLPTDAQLELALAECFWLDDSPHDAARHFRNALARLADTDPAAAAECARRLSAMDPRDVTLRLRQAELLEDAKDFNGAYEVLLGALDEVTRAGRRGEVGRIAAMALRLRPGDPRLHGQAGRAALAAGDLQAALHHLGAARDGGNDDIEVLSAWAEALQQADRVVESRVALSQLARRRAAAGDRDGELAALQRALDLGETDPAIRDRMRRARVEIEARRLRLTDLPAARPANEGDVRACVRAQVLLRYGFGDRALECLRAAVADLPTSLPVSFWLVEALARAGRTEEAATEAGRLLARLPAEDRAPVEIRIAVLSGKPLDAFVGVVSTTSDLAQMLTDEAPDDLLDDLDAITDERDLAPFSGRMLLQDEPDDDLPVPVAPAGGLFRTSPPAPDDALSPEDLDLAEDDPIPTTAPDPFADLGLGPVAYPAAFHEIDPAALPPAGPVGQQAWSVARGLLALGHPEHVASVLAGDRSLGALELLARAQVARGEARAALETLEPAVVEADDHDPSYVGALIALADVLVAAGQLPRARRLLDALGRTHPGQRDPDRLDRLAALEHLLD